MAKKLRKGIAGSGSGKKAAGQTRGQSERDPKGRIGQYTAAGNSALTKK